MKRIFQHIVLLLFVIGFANKISAQQNLQVKGNASAQIKYYTITGNSPDSRQPYVFTLNAQPVISWKGWNITTRFVFGNYQTPYRDFNRYGISPHKNNTTIYLGHTTLNWNSFAIEARPMLGAGFEFTPKKLRLGFFEGMINRASLQDTFRSRVFSPAYRRLATAVKIGYGTEFNYLNLVFVRAADNKNTLQNTESKGVTPAENAVLSFQLAKKLGKYFQFNASSGFSAYTRNILASGEPFTHRSLAVIPSSVITTNSSTQLLSAWNATLQTKLPGNLNVLKRKFQPAANIGYDRIDPGYQSMALYFLVNDIERVKGAFQLQSNDRKILVVINAGMEHNDILKTQFIRNKRNIYGLNGTINPKPGVSLNVNIQNYSVKLLADVAGIDDSLIINQVNRNYTVGYSSFASKKTVPLADKLRMQLSAGYQSGKNITSLTGSRNLSHLYFISGFTPALKPGTWKLSPAYAVHYYKQIGGSSTRHLPTLAIGHLNAGNNLTLRLESGLMLTWFQKKFNTFGWRNYAYAFWQINKKNFLTSSIFVQPNLQKNNNFMEIQADLRYNLRF